MRGSLSDCAEIEAEIELGDAQQVGLRVRSTSDGDEETLIGFDRDTQSLFCDTSHSSKDPETANLPSFLGANGIQRGSLKLEKGEPLRIRVYVDASVLEIFASGKISLSDRVYPSNPESLGVGLFSRGGNALLRSMTLWKLKPISPDRMTSGAELFQV